MADVKVIIKIPEEVYKSIQDNDYCGISNSDMFNAIVNGVPLPKGHGRIGDFDVFLEGFLFDKRADNLECGWIRELIEQATIIEADKSESE